MNTHIIRTNKEYSGNKIPCTYFCLKMWLFTNIDEMWILSVIPGIEEDVFLVKDVVKIGLEGGNRRLRVDLLCKSSKTHLENANSAASSFSRQIF